MPADLIDQLANDPDFLQLSEQERNQMYEELSRSRTRIPLSRSPFDAPWARTTFGALGGIGGGLATAPESFGMAAPLGGLGGAVAGESLRQFLAHLTGGGPQTGQEQAQELIGQAGTQAEAEAGGPLLAKGAGLALRGGKLVIRNLASLFGIPTKATARVLERGAQTVLRPEFAEGVVPESLRAKVVDGLKAFQDHAETTYSTGLKGLQPKLQSTVTSLKPVIEGFQQQLLESGIVNSSGHLVESEFPPDVVPEVTAWKGKIKSILDRLTGYAGQALPTERAIRLKRELDTMMDYASDEVAKIPENAVRLVKGLRNSLRSATETAIPELQPINAEYHSFRDVYDSLQPSLRDKNIESTVQGLGSLRNTYSMRQMQAMESSLPPEKRFLNDVQDFLAAKEFSRDVSPFVERAELALGGFGGYKAGGIPGMIFGALAAPSVGTPRALAAGLKAGERFITYPLGKVLQAIGSGGRPSQALTQFLSVLLRNQGRSVSSLSPGGGAQPLGGLAGSTQ